MKKSKGIGLLIAFPISIAALWLAFRNVPIAELGAYFRNLDYIWLLPAIFFCLMGYVFRAWRWQHLLARTRKVSFFSAFHPMMIGFMLNCILPGRVGELIRPALLARKEKIPFVTSFSTIAAERVLDLTVLLAFLSIIFSFTDMGAAKTQTIGGFELSGETLTRIAGNMAWICFVLIGIIVFMQVPCMMEKGKKVIRGLALSFPGLPAGFRQSLSSRILPALEKLLDQISSGFDGLRSPPKLFICILLSLCVWGIQVLPFWFLSQASAGISPNLIQLAAVMVLVNFFIAIPSVPGFWGIWEAGVVFSLAFFGIRGADAAGYALLSHAVLMFPVIFVGMGSAFMTGFRISSGKSKSARESLESEG
ncbi:lysylphosphatidylglycerol synthase transmembrane domain-containing protein [Desulfobotulus mexicanus]|uniref:Flippase-like domain-containing protein n=1 Tax=Desulfobotulus mexicanus TaxID=2586642 RepID=A0A5Q4VGX7_9BACT|nr:lysylphosphatidylglycerol synthase transmembrane domain-containing protein [Desulfobotulus mexicanus]TYT75420.1 flippase-like domain-containing protein [Desulfobotulus mexicanus]